jgi:hypothetical protein
MNTILFGKSSHRSDVIKSGKESSTAETCSSEDQAELQGGSSKEFSSDHHQPKDTLSPLGSEWTEDSLGGGDTMRPQREKKNSYNPCHVSWRPSITSYSVQEKRALKFPSTEEIDCAISLCWNDPDLKDMPRAYAGNLTMVVPENSVELFRAKGLNFEVLRVLSQSDLLPERYESLKRKYGM